MDRKKRYIGCGWLGRVLLSLQWNPKRPWLRASCWISHHLSITLIHFFSIWLPLSSTCCHREKYYAQYVNPIVSTPNFYLIVLRMLYFCPYSYSRHQTSTVLNVRECGSHSSIDCMDGLPLNIFIIMTMLVINIFLLVWFRPQEITLLYVLLLIS